MSKIYLAGDMLNRGAQLQRAEEREAILATGNSLYSPMDNKDINDKSKADNTNLAERIVAQDTNAIIGSDIVIAEPLTHALGTNIELGQIHGMKLVAHQILSILSSDTLGNTKINKIIDLCEKHLNRKVYCHNSDIRRTNTEPRYGDRSEFGNHAYMYGIVLALTDGQGFTEFNDILKEIEPIKTTSDEIDLDY